MSVIVDGPFALARCLDKHQEWWLTGAAPSAEAARVRDIVFQICQHASRGRSFCDSSNRMLTVGHVSKGYRLDVGLFNRQNEQSGEIKSGSLKRSKNDNTTVTPQYNAPHYNADRL